MRSVSPFLARAKRRNFTHTIRARAPKHPKAPEARLRLLVAKVVGMYHDHLRANILKIAPGYLARRRRRYDQKERLRSQSLVDCSRNLTSDGAEEMRYKHHPLSILTPPAPPIPFLSPSVKRNDADDSTANSILASSWDYALSLLHGTAFKPALDKAAKQVATSAKQQTQDALDLGPDYDPDLSPEIDQLASGVFDATKSLMGDSLTRAEDVLDEWSDLDPDYSDRAGSTDALDTMLGDGLDGIMGKALAAAALAFGAAFGEMVQGAQEDAGVGQAMWLSQRDSRVRLAHLALDGVIFSWDDPPLKAEDADNNEDCFPGSDYNCRCQASPIAPDEELTARQQERI